MLKPEWKQPCTQKVYLHPPLAERIVMLWPDFKITNYSFLDNGKHVNQESTGFVLLHDHLDFRNTVFCSFQDGFPIHKVKADLGYELTMEAFCTMDRNPNVSCKIRVYNPNAYIIQDSFTILARTGMDKYLSNCAETGYASYCPNPGTFLLLKDNWNNKNGIASDGKGFLQVTPSSNVSVEWQQAEGITDKFVPDRCYKAYYSLEPGEECCIYVYLRYGELPNIDNYQTAMETVKIAWRNILNDIKIVPKTDNQVYQNVFTALAAQAMQMLARYEGKEWIIPRQGDVGCFVWIWEAVHLLNLLDRIGLSSNTYNAYRYFIFNWIHEGGEDDGKVESNHQQWDNLNGALIWGISQHLLYVKSEEEFTFFRPYLNRCLEWIQRKRQLSMNDAEHKYRGLFQPGKGSDFDDVARHWIFTDATNVRGIKKMAEAYMMFDAPESSYIKTIYEDYQNVMERVINEMYAGHEHDDVFLIPHNLGVPFEDTETQCYSINSIVSLMDCGIIPYNAPICMQMENWLRKRGFYHSPLKGRMTCVDMGNYGTYAETYYTVNGEMPWIRAYLARGEYDKAAETFQALMKYCMTKEYIVSERYSPLDEWFSPWQPNASSTARIMDVMLDYFGERKVGQ